MSHTPAGSLPTRRKSAPLPSSSFPTPLPPPRCVSYIQLHYVARCSPASCLHPFGDEVSELSGGYFRMLGDEHRHRPLFRRSDFSLVADVQRHLVIMKGTGTGLKMGVVLDVYAANVAKNTSEYSHPLNKENPYLRGGKNSPLQVFASSSHAPNFIATVSLDERRVALTGFFSPATTFISI